MTMRQIIAMLQDMGVEVKYTERKDGGVRITYINGQKFSGSTGNTLARSMVGVSLSTRRAHQLKIIKTRKGRRRRKRKTDILDDEVKQQIKRVQRKLRKNATKGHGGTITTAQVRKIWKEEGRESAMAKLERAERYAEGYVYDERVDSLILRLEMDKQKLRSQDQAKLQEIINKLKEHKSHMKEEDFEAVKEYLYAWEIGQIKIDVLYSTIMNLSWK